MVLGYIHRHAMQTYADYLIASIIINHIIVDQLLFFSRNFLFLLITTNNVTR